MNKNEAIEFAFRNFSNSFSMKPVLFTIKVKNNYIKLAQGFYKNDQEVMINHGQKFKVNKV